MMLLGSANALEALPLGRDVLVGGGSALDAVEAVIRWVEDNPEDHTVGYGGYPNILGEVELDASIMEGATRRAGAVAALRGYPNPITVARRVMERLPHVLLVGDGAARFAAECGIAAADTLSDEARATWERGIATLPEGEGALAGPLAAHVRRLVLDPDHVTGTVNVIARDDQGRLVSGASTSGWAWKYPGRCGDTGAIGAGNYCDDRFGAAACTGWGELAVRSAGAALVVTALRHGATLAEACALYLGDLADPDIGEGSVPLHLVAADADGGHYAASTTSTAQYAYWDPTLEAPEVRPRVHVPA